MPRPTMFVCLACSILETAAWCQVPTTPTQSDAAEPQDHRAVKLPSWLQLGVELRGRAQSENPFDALAANGIYMNRLRFDLALKPAPWLRFFFEAQDARALRLNSGPDPEELRNALDIRQAFADLGKPEKGWLLRVGRQELVVGDERLVGADGYWDCFGQGFDAVRIAFSGAKFHAQSFIGFRVEPAPRSMDSFDHASRIAGISFQFSTAGQGVVEPYLLWRRGGRSFDLLETPGHRDVLVPGVRAQASLPHALDYNVEMALQRGHVVRDHISAWAGHWELGWRPFGDGTGLRLGLEYNYASGDRDPSDGVYGTFDDLYPAGFNKYGMQDPIAWRNIRYPAVAAEMPLTRRWTIYGGYRSYWLATSRDGLYPGGDAYLVRTPDATSAEVGSLALVSAGYVRSPRWKWYAGYGYFFPGAFLRQSGYQAPLKTAYALFSFTL